MKTAFSTLVLLTFGFTIIVNSVHSQASNSDTDDKKNKGVKKNARIAARLNKANYRASRDFRSEFKDDADVKWHNAGKVICAYFHRDDINTYVVFNAAGRRLRSMKVYNDNKMENDVRILLKQEYANYQIPLIQEIKEGYNKFYLVHVEDDKEYKQLAVYNGEVDVFRGYRKSSGSQNLTYNSNFKFHDLVAVLTSATTE